jgi:hypothetical protein
MRIDGVALSCCGNEAQKFHPIDHIMKAEIEEIIAKPQAITQNSLAQNHGSVNHVT